MILFLCSICSGEKVALNGNPFVDTLKASIAGNTYRYDFDAFGSSGDTVANIRFLPENSSGSMYFRIKKGDTINAFGAFKAKVENIKLSGRDTITLDILSKDTNKALAYINSAEYDPLYGFNNFVFGLEGVGEKQSIRVREDTMNITSDKSIYILRNGAKLNVFPTFVTNKYNVALVTLPRDTVIPIDYNIDFSVSPIDGEILHYFFSITPIPYNKPWAYPLNVIVKLTTPDTTYIDTSTEYCHSSHNMQRNQRKPMDIVIGEITIDYTNTIAETNESNNTMADTSFSTAIRHFNKTTHVLRFTKNKSQQFTLSGKKIPAVLRDVSRIVVEKKADGSSDMQSILRK